jgi:hypothetical protein
MSVKIIFGTWLQEKCRLGINRVRLAPRRPEKKGLRQPRLAHLRENQKRIAQIVVRIHFARWRYVGKTFRNVRRLLLRSVARVFPIEAFNAAGGVQNLLLAREKRVTVGADFNTQHRALHGGLGLKRMSASAVNGYFVVVGMDAVFHCYLPCGRSARQDELRLPRR